MQQFFHPRQNCPEINQNNGSNKWQQWQCSPASRAFVARKFKSRDVNFSLLYLCGAHNSQVKQNRPTCWSANGELALHSQKSHLLCCGRKKA
jgi:hypothetical protein